MPFGTKRMNLEAIMLSQINNEVKLPDGFMHVQNTNK